MRVQGAKAQREIVLECWMGALRSIGSRGGAGGAEGVGFDGRGREMVLECGRGSRFVAGCGLRAEAPP